MNLDEFYLCLPEEEKILALTLRDIIAATLPNLKEKFAYGTPFFYGNRRVCFIWPASIPRGGFSHGVMLGFCQGDLLENSSGYVSNNGLKKVWYRILYKESDINIHAIVELLHDADRVDGLFSKSAKVSVKK